MIIEKRMHGDLKEHKHGEYDYWHLAARIHCFGMPQKLEGRT
jgi:hypothetical protein